MTPSPEAALPEPRAKPPGKVKVFNCPSCGGSVSLRAVGQSVTAQCSHCSTLIDVANENYSIILAANEQARTGDLELGARGVLQGIEWEVVGFQFRNDGEGTNWSEYLLFNPYQGYRFLINESGHWTLARMLRRDLPGFGDFGEYTFEGQHYRKFSEGRAYTHYVGGEFYWRASTDDVSRSMDYISPPYRLFMEQSASEIIYSHGEYVPATTVANAFKTRLIEPSILTVAPNQPNPFFASISSTVFVALVAFVAMTGFQFVQASRSDNAVAAQARFSFTSADKDKAMTLQEFTMPKDGNLDIRTSANLDNNWLELDVSVVNTSTEQSFDAVQGMEYYSGTDSDGSWSEGDPTSTVSFSHVPAGNYKLVVSPDAGSFAASATTGWKPATLNNGVLKSVLGLGQDTATPPVVGTSPPITGQIELRRDVTIWSNYLIALLLIAIYPIYLVGRGIHFESMRGGGSGSDNDSDSSDSSDE